MNKKELIEMGLTDEQATQVESKFKEGLSNYIPKSRFDEVNGQAKELKGKLEEHNRQLEDLKKTSGMTDELKAKLEEAQQNNEKYKQEYEGKIAKMKLDSSLNDGLRGVGAKNLKATKALLNMDNIKLDGDKLLGFSEQLETIKKENPYLFNDGEPKKEEPVLPSGVIPRQTPPETKGDGAKPQIGGVGALASALKQTFNK